MAPIPLLTWGMLRGALGAVLLLVACSEARSEQLEDTSDAGSGVRSGVSEARDASAGRAGNAGTTTTGGAGSGAGGATDTGEAPVFASGAVAPSPSCIVDPDTDTFLAAGQYDIAAGANDACLQPYVVNLMVESRLQGAADPETGRAEPNVLQLHSAEVSITTPGGGPILFDQMEPPLPNPFLVSTNNSLFPATDGGVAHAIAAIEAIPVAYAERLDRFAGDTLLLELRVFGTTTGDVDVDLPVFLHTVTLCNGCLTVCDGDLAAQNRTAEDVNAGQCPDNAGADGRFCIDPDC